MPKPSAGAGRFLRLRGCFELIRSASRLRWRRYEIADHSMRPALQDGDWVLGVAGSRCRAGDVVIADMPGRTDFVIVKRVAAIDPVDGSLWLVGDDAAAGSVDSRTFGSVPPGAVTARLVLRYRPLPPKWVR